MTRDLLADIRSGALTAEAAEAVAGEVLASPEAGQIVERLGLSKKEYTAYLHGAPFDEIARWRFQGWPKRCARCSKPLDSDQYGWRVRETALGAYELEHLTCP